MSPAPPAPEPVSLPVPPVNDDGEEVTAPRDVQHFYQELIGEGKVQGYQQGKGYTMDDIDLVISRLTDDKIQSTKDIINPRQKTLRSWGKKKERNEGLRIDMQGTIKG